MKRKWISFTLAMGMAASLLFTGCSGSPSGASSSAAPDTGTIKIGVASPLTGTCAEDGKSIVNGVQIAVDQINETGGIDGKTVEIVSEDDKGDASEAATVANKLAEDSSIVGIVGHYNSSCTLAGASIYEEAGVVTVSPGSSAASVSEAGDYIFRVITTDAVQGNDLVNWAVSELGYTKFAVLYENSDYGLGLADVVSKAAEDLGATVSVKESYESGQTDFSTVLTKVANSDAQVLFVGGLYNETALIAKQRSSYGLGDMQIMGVDAIFSNALIDLGGDAVNGIKLTGYFSNSSTSKVTQDFIAAYEDKYGENPGTYAAYGYDAALVILDAVKNVGTDRTAIKDYLYTVKDFEGATGTFSFDENGDVIKEPLHLQIKDGAFALDD